MHFEMFNNHIQLRRDDKVLAEISFPEVKPGVVDINHTFVDESLRGKGVAGEMMLMVANELTNSNRKAICSCSFAIKWFGSHPEFKALLLD
ncbi:GNAT family N-acetyltransferase [Anaerorhabdus sp.]|uniref:GNAT family N-acetyltransferase n=1 Tax=Anaerorhabdus sp. TaxID=1872524 RepID=UPI002FCA4E21